MKAMIAGAFLAGGAATLTASQLFNLSANAAGYRFQNEHVWVARKNPDGGVPIYASRTCGYLIEPKDAGQVDVCGKDGEEMNYVSAKAFEAYLKARGIAAPR